MNVKQSNPEENVMPEAELYEQELVYMPYKMSLKDVLSLVSNTAPINACLVDMMCGTGYLLGKISEKRPDLNLLGVDIDPRYVSYAKLKYPNIKFEIGDVLTWNPGIKFNVVTCTGALHHIPYEKQDEALGNIARLVEKNPAGRGYALVSDCYIGEYSSELERRLAAAEFGYEYLKATIRNEAPQSVNGIAADILKNDILMDEFKTSVSRREEAFKNHFDYFNTWRVWPKTGDVSYGDYITILSEPKN